MLLGCFSCSTLTQSNNPDRILKKHIASDRPLVIKNRTFTDDIDFTLISEMLLVNQRLHKGVVLAPLYFENCTFEGEVLAYSNKDNEVSNIRFRNPVSFIGCIFEKQVSFRGAEFESNVHFDDSVFRKKVSFEEARFNHKASFKAVVFEGEGRMQNTFFKDHAYFNDFQSKNTLSFQGAYFQGDFLLSMSKHFGYVDLTKMKCYGEVLLNYSAFLKKLVIRNSSFYQRFDLVKPEIVDFIMESNVFYHSFIHESVQIDGLESNTFLLRK